MPDPVRCAHCELRQNPTSGGLCRRCRKVLPQGTVESTTVVIIDRQTLTKSFFADGFITLQQAMQQQAVAAMKVSATINEAASRLGISPKRVKKLLREAGDTQDYRYGRASRVTKQKDNKVDLVKAWQASRRARGLCIRCGNPRGEVKGANCEDCLKKRRDYRKRMSAT